MPQIRIKASTIARLAALVITLINQALVLFGQDMLPFASNSVYQIVSFAITIIIVAGNAWYNNDITKIALLSGRVFNAMKDGKITEAEVDSMLNALESSEAEKTTAAQENFFVKIINKILRAIKKPKSNE